MDALEALQFLCLKAAVDEDGDFVYRRISRWYSRTYHTPLHEVENLPMEYILTHFFESRFEEMTKAQINALIKKLTETVEEKAAREREENGISDEEFLAQTKKDRKKRARKKKAAEKAAVEKVEKEGNRDFLDAKQTAAKIAEAINVPSLDGFEIKFDPNLSDEDALTPRKG